MNISDPILQPLLAVSEQVKYRPLGTAQALVGEEYMSVGFNVASIQTVMGGPWVLYVLAGKNHDIPASGLQ